MPTFKISVTVCLLIACLSLSAQNKKGVNKESRSSIGLAFFSFLTPPEEISRLYEKGSGADFTSKQRFSYQGKFEYSHLIGNSFEASLGIIVGVYPIDFNISLENGFSPIGRAYNFLSIDRGGFLYGGITINMGYIKNLGDRQFLSIRAGANYVIFIPQYYNFHFSWHTGTQVLQVFEARSNINPEGKAFLAPELALRYHRKFGKFITPYVGLDGVYSTNRPIVGRQFTIYGANENLHGTFTRQFVHYGVELGLKVTIVN